MVTTRESGPRIARRSNGWSATTVSWTSSFARSSYLMRCVAASSLARFHELVRYASLLAKNWLVDWNTSAITRKPLARREVPVSVPSMVASEKYAALASVAPQENSVCASMPWRANHMLDTRVNSVEMVNGDPLARLVSHSARRSSTVRTGEDSGTASTHLMGRDVWREYC